VYICTLVAAPVYTCTPIDSALEAAIEVGPLLHLIGLAVVLVVALTLAVVIVLPHKVGFGFRRCPVVDFVGEMLVVIFGSET